LIEGGADPCQLFYVSTTASAAKPKAVFGRTIIRKSMTANITPNKNAVEGFYPKSGEWILTEGGVDSRQLVHWIFSPWPQHENLSCCIKSQNGLMQDGIEGIKTKILTRSKIASFHRSHHLDLKDRALPLLHFTLVMTNNSQSIQT